MSDEILKTAIHLEGHSTSWDADEIAKAAKYLRLMEEWMRDIIETWHCGDIKPEDIARGRALLALSSHHRAQEK